MISVRPTAVQTGIWGIGTATPPSIHQSALTELAEDRCCDEGNQRAWLRRVFSRCGVGRRNSVLQTSDISIADFYPKREPTTAERMRRYAIEAPGLATRAADIAMQNASVIPSEITHLISVSCTGFSAPGLDIELIDRLNLNPNIQRMQIGFMGCHAALNALSAAQAIVRGEPTATVLVCCVELCSLHFNYGFEPSQLIASALFSDGAGAAIVREGAPSGIKRAGVFIMLRVFFCPTRATK